MTKPQNSQTEPPRTRSAQMGAYAGIALGIVGATLIAPLLFPQVPGHGINWSQVVCAGALGGVGAAIGAGIGSLIGRSRKRHD